ncbi:MULTISPECIES: HD domain-containing phosphohydrolase [Methylobacterium]|jgi:putative nucleotidyltransferase with HDIG domain|nr:MULTISPECIES: HD domain-containing phosphohydrolase [Methylobacterium]MBK3395968.1 HD domain-containing protein [Methylobacterium ajmalii]MBK3409701.1 HD domain-containing protein [Methylobacterium ajmalii]MBK3425148.1 HD domain-containing protein [Methylobacterium ajmalii]MBZ6413554.1 HD domain-containing protein [Methylobacterium sp.]SFF37425.1 HDIG domain-containing protein [Methylobacterium sp. yr596]
MPDERTFVLVTDRPDRSAAISAALRGIGLCDVVGPDETWRGRRALAGVVSDMTLARPEADHCLRTLQRRFPDKNLPVICLLRKATQDALRHAKTLGATVCMPAYVPPETIVAALANQVGIVAEGEAQTVSQGVARAGEALNGLLAEARAGQPLRMGAVEAGLGPILTAVREGGLARWLDTVWTHDDATYQHCLLVAGHAAQFSLHLGFRHEDQLRFVRAALIHDVGKARIPLEILNKPGRLTPDEMVVMRTHAAIGHEILVAGGERDPITLAAARHHHEMLDGSGYPDGLVGSQIGDIVRLLTICDIYAALTERRPYKAPMPMADAMAILSAMDGKLEARLVQSFGESLKAAG